MIDQDFSSENLNDKVLVSTKLRETDLKRTNLKDYILKNTTVANHKKSVISLGNCDKYPDGWFYIQMVNAGASPKFRGNSLYYWTYRTKNDLKTE